jgi:aldehyde dehydrogenase (NAD+)
MSARADIFKVQMEALGLGERPQSLIDGDLVDGAGDPITLVDPYTEDPLTTYTDAGSALATAACAAAQAAQIGWAALSGGRAGASHAGHCPRGDGPY